MLADNIRRLRAASGMTQKQLAARLNVAFQTISKWETGASAPDTAMLPELARALGTDINRLVGFVLEAGKEGFYDGEFAKEAYFWGTEPALICYQVMRYLPPVRPLRVLCAGCGEGKDAVFFARNGYRVTAFDAVAAGIDKAKQLAAAAGVSVDFFQADILSSRVDAEFDIVFSSGLMNFIPGELRRDILCRFQKNTPVGGIHSHHVFVQKPFIATQPERLAYTKWESGELFGYYTDWEILFCEEEIYDCDSSGIPHKHCINRIIARKVV